jgi:hypothetical protein
MGHPQLEPKRRRGIRASVLERAFLICGGNAFVKQELNVDPAILGPS